MKQGGALLAQQLENFGVTHVFGVPGESYLPLLDGLLDTNIKFVNARHEGGAAFMACAWGQLTDAPGICLVTRGPGATNASIGVHTARQGSVPMILFIGQVDQDMLGREAFQEIDYGLFYRDVAKAVIEVRETDRLPELVSQAWSVALSGRKGPVVVVLPADVLFHETQATPLAHKPVVIAPVAPRETMESVFNALSVSKRPLVLYGGSSWTEEGRRDLESFAGKLNLPVASAFRRQDGFDNHHRSYVGDIGLGIRPYLREAIETADLILAINLRFGENSTDGYTLFDLPRMKQKLIHVHNAPEELNKVYQADIAVVASPNQFCKALNAMHAKPFAHSWQQGLRVAYLNASAPPAQNGKLDLGAVMQTLQERAWPNAVLTNGAGNFAIWPSKYFRFSAHQNLIAPQSGAMGYGLPAAIAAKIYAPERQVICFAGDGDFQMTLAELGTALQEQAFPIVLVFNNGSYGTIRMHQEKHFKARVSGTALKNPNFSAIAEAYGMGFWRVERTDDFEVALRGAVNSETGALIELVCDINNISPLMRLDTHEQSATLC